MVDERTIVSDLKSYVDELKDEGFEAKVEIHPSGAKRADLIIYYNKKILINIEYKKPTVIEGKDPRATDLVMDAHFKANNLNPPSRFFGTSNFNETIIWDNSDITRPVLSRDIEIVHLPIKIVSDDDFNKDNVKQALRLYIKQLAYRLRDLLSEKVRIHYKPLGESFIEGLNAHLNLASEACIKYVPINILKKWWREQHYDPVTEFGDEEKKRIAKYSLYVLANKIMFYYVLKRSFNLPEMNIPDNGKIKDLENLILKNFNEAKKQSGNYETVFEDSDADKIPFLNDECFYPVSTLIKFFKEYNFSALSQDILGNIYDRLIAPVERHAFGQYYTPIPVVDLINALTIKNSDARVLDPACGSGTFLSRAFDLKLKLNGQDNEDVRKKFLSELFGVEIASYPAHLATIALASKLLVYNPDIYPNIIKDDFLNIQTEMVIPKWKFALNINHKTTDLKGMEKEVIFKPIDAVVSNLPYIRQENIDNKDSEQNKVENFLYQNGFSKDRPNNTSDFHVYFWYYILPFLKEGSRVGFLTSDTWLNVEYGNDLKKFISKYFKIIAIIDSSVERWFEDALVNTVITVLERTDDKEKRKNNKIKFVRIHRKISELIKDLDDALKIAEDIENGISSDYIEIMREVRQGDLDFDDVMKSKLFPYLRAPSEFFDFVNSSKMIPLGKIMDVRFGIKTGANEFFYVEDVTDSYSEEDLKKVFGLRRGEIKKLRIVKNGEGTEHVIEKEYLSPILKSPKEFTEDGKLAFYDKTKKYVVLITETDRNKIKKNALRYIEYGETHPTGEPYSERPTCKGRKSWWVLSPIIYPELVFTMHFSSTFIYPKTNILLDHTMYYGKMFDNYKNDLATIYSFMNSSLSYMYPDFFGRNLGGGGAPVGFMVYEVQNLPVPNPEIMRPYYERLTKIMGNLEKRRIGSVFEEIWDMKGEFSLEKVKEDRLNLDRTILEALGFKNPDEFLKNWYPKVVKIVKERLDKAKSLKTSKSPKKSLSRKIASEILERIDIKNFPDDYITDYDVVSTIYLKKGNKISKGRDLNGFYVSVDGRKSYFDKEVTEYVYFCAIRKIENIPIPRDIINILETFKEDLKLWKSKLDEEISSITDDEDYKEKLHKICSEKANYSGLL